MQAARRALRVASTALMAAAIALAVALVGVRLVGLTPYAVLSGSMEPTYHVGSVVYVRPCDPLQLAEGDVITFMLDEDTLATHRIVQVVPAEEDPAVVRFQTQGDANDAPDGSLVHCNNVVGTPVLTIPYLGYLADYVQGPPGCYVAVAVCAVLVMLTFIPDLFAKEEEGEKRKTKASAAKTPGAARATARNAAAAPSTAHAPARSAATPTRHPERRRAAPESKDPVRREARTAPQAASPQPARQPVQQRGKHARNAP